MCLQRPHDSRVLVRKRYRGHIFVSPADDRTDPVARVGPLAHAIDAPLGSGGWTVGGSLNCGWGRPSIAYDAIAAGEEKAGPLLKVVLTHPALVCLVCSVRVYGRRWTSLNDLGCRGQKTRLQLRSSLTTLAKKVIGKQRLTVLVNVSSPAPSIPRENVASRRFPFFISATVFRPRARCSSGAARAGWQSGYAAACKAVYAGSIPTPASKIINTLDELSGTSELPEVA